MIEEGNDIAISGRHSQQLRDEVHDHIKDNINEIVNQAAEEVMLKQQQSSIVQGDVEQVLDDLDRDLSETFNLNASAIEVNADVHESLWQLDGHRDSEDNESLKSISPAPSIDLNQSCELADKTSTPIKVRTIKKHSKVNRELTSKPGTTIRPNVEDIEWDIGGSEQVENAEKSAKSSASETASKIIRSTTRLTSAYTTIDNQADYDIISSEKLENVSQTGSIDNDMHDQEPENLIIAGQVDDGEQALLYDDDIDIDEVILVQTPGSDFGSESGHFLIRECLETKTISKTKVENGEKIEEITVITEEHFPDGQVLMHKEEKQTKRTPSSEQEDASRELGFTNISTSINSDTDSDSRIESPYQIVQSSTASGNNKNVTTTRKRFGSSSSSDVALHETGGELSDDEPGT